MLALGRYCLFQEVASIFVFIVVGLSIIAITLFVLIIFDGFMKQEIHPTIKQTEFNCACGKSFTSMSVLGGKVHLDICAACHPFFTGKEKLLDIAGRIEKFKSRYERPPPVKPKPSPKQKLSAQSAREKLVIQPQPRATLKPRLVRRNKDSAVKPQANDKQASTKKAVPGTERKITTSKTTSIESV